MITGICFRYSELFDQQATMDELIELVKRVPLRHAAFVLSRINLALRYAMQEEGRANFGKVQEFLVSAHMDDETLGLMKQRFPTARCDERPVFLPQCILTVFRLVVSHSVPEPLPKTEEDEFVRYIIGRACLMMNDLQFTTEEEKALLTGSEDERRVELMVQMMAGFELTNPQKADHLMPRLQLMYRVLLKNPRVRSRIALQCEGFDIESEFHRLVGVSLDQWLFIVFALYAYFLEGANMLDPKPEYMLLNPSVFCRESSITREALKIVLGTMAIPMDDLKSTILNESSTDPRYDFVSFRSRPIIEAEEGKLLPADLAFIVEKCHTGVQWTLHDLLPIKKRQALFSAWGLLFEEYVHWLLEVLKTDLPIHYIRSPKWKNSADESFDGILLKGGVLMPAEFKGGFLPRSARYSGNSKIFLKELNKKFSPGCDQLADKIGALFADDDRAHKELEDVKLEHIRSVVPLLILQDHIFRVPFLNWYLNKRFKHRMARCSIRPGVAICPLTVVTIQDLESIIHAAEGGNFDFIYALHNRTIRDQDVGTDLMEALSSFKDFGGKPSPRIKLVLDQVAEQFSHHLFPSQAPPPTLS